MACFSCGNRVYSTVPIDEKPKAAQSVAKVAPVPETTPTPLIIAAVEAVNQVTRSAKYPQ